MFKIYSKVEMGPETNREYNSFMDLHLPLENKNGIQRIIGMLQLQLPKVTDTAVLLSVAKCRAVEIRGINYS
jgi:hypothetical protein